MKDIPVTVIVATCGRYTTTLPLCLLSIVNQTIIPKTLILVDDNKEKKFYDHEILKNILVLLKIKGINFEYYYGPSKGHPHAQNIAISHVKTDWFFTTDDDNVLEPNVIEYLIKNINDNVGAISGLILSRKDVQENRKIEYISYDTYNKINDIYRYFNIQMCMDQDDTIKRVEHIYSNYLARTNIVEFPLDFTDNCHRHETVTTYSIYRKGFDLLIDPRVKIWHLDEKIGGSNLLRYDNKNDKLFLSKLKDWGIEINVVEDDRGVYEKRDGNLWKIYDK